MNFKKAVLNSVGDVGMEVNKVCAMRNDQLSMINEVMSSGLYRTPRFIHSLTHQLTNSLAKFQANGLGATAQGATLWH
jgi:hypothetical protein